MSIDDSIRRQLARAARRPRSRNRGNFSPGRPTKWQPTQVIDPAADLDVPFTNAGAWELIASKLEIGHHVDVEIHPNAPLLYVKLELRSGKIFGRSFHYTEHE